MKLLINGAEAQTIAVIPGAIGEPTEWHVTLNGVLMCVELPQDFGPGHVCNVDGRVIEWGGA